MKSSAKRRGDDDETTLLLLLLDVLPINAPKGEIAPFFFFKEKKVTNIDS